MPPANDNNKNEFAKHVALFLAELIRSRRIDLQRAADIAQKVVQNINLIDSESQFLEFVKELHRDFDELHALVDIVHMHVHMSARKDLENKVSMYVASIMPSDMGLAVKILEEAIVDGVTEEALCQKFPGFKEYVEINPKLWNKNHA
ncbi:MAG: hypothetical protein A3I07_01785 [Candidatus Doudnabacteria bacterium RIFCSPLOWO2_02_FULL_42_9]|uniref:Uncharacterized protein n=1 Tax=Candidatus Doudnabacteria bacterium RIFCSPHIGHO2_01_FULL_41_86 TaxID=1817821 RepID=A0A1F5N9N1_9BACT|nr:MAG: hypothetical protein A2717_01205 [Candidatus Doudnabacteria bacterium RIFCSPHIGHO2_01_FULL_41_86]OGE74844.1 MAG: hypothetical protein A3K07_02780 [Candidatus Doudnabacteria bacterium RIFCSPHIGHO2_01_43_10]OGE85188.1 MAG: hypothetical protein A3E28_00770 [Candidatus Doudnabacteria bacterium RIFCSPHIGHO2_12_FULL_42_22]OGE86726.1 MAG: hypothetical protein A3C49_01605 [Candidatus Doudnabacteria bacterium RIFCSPHIGHO2_02_FULL_42_25]OGE92324.1 MAG: hypothetical protein A2895_01760 [Candidatus